MPRISAQTPAGGAARPGGPLFGAVVGTAAPEPDDAEVAARRGREAERARIAQALHDGLCQELLGLACQLQALAASAKEAGCPSAPKLQEAAALVGAAMDATRAVVQDLLPPALENGALRPALERLLAEPGAVLVPDPEPRLSPAVAMEVYHIAQEAVRNAQRHSGAGQIRLALEDHGATYTLRVEDDGRGFAAGPDAGCGLRVMQRRAATIGAQWCVEARPGGGTVVTCTGPKLVL